MPFQNEWQRLLIRTLLCTLLLLFSLRIAESLEEQVKVKLSFTIFFHLVYFRCTVSPHPPLQLIGSCLSCLATAALREPHQVTDADYIEIPDPSLI